MDVREKLVELLAKYFDIGDSYAYNLTRVKSAFACGTMGFDDFEEFDEETVADIADHLIANGVTVQEWISVEDRLPEMGEHYQSEDVLVCIDYRPDDPDTTKDSYVSIDHVDFNCFGQGWFSCERDDPRDGEPSPYFVTHWMPMPLVESTGLICHSRRKENDNETD